MDKAVGYWDQIWSMDFLINLSSEGIGVLVELVLVYFIVNILLQRRENIRWKPVRELVAKTTDELYEALLSCAALLVPKDEVEDTNTHQGKVDYAQNQLKKTGELLNSLAQRVDLTGHGLTSTQLPDVIQFLEDVRFILERLHFFNKLYSKEHTGFDIVEDFPYEKLCGLQVLRDSIIEGVTIPKSQNILPSLKELKDSWFRYSQSHPRLFLDLETYQNDGKGRSVFVYSPQSILKLKASPSVIQSFRS